MTIRPAQPSDRAVMLDIWVRSVRATHSFLTEEDIQFFYPLVRDVALVQLELWVLEDDRGGVIGFLGMSGQKIEALFLAPEHFRKGGGTLLVEHARALKGDLEVDVNEQNPDACRFYEKCGFVVVGRSEQDSTGKSFPLLHLRSIQS